MSKSKRRSFLLIDDPLRNLVRTKEQAERQVRWWYGMNILYQLRELESIRILQEAGLWRE